MKGEVEEFCFVRRVNRAVVIRMQIFFSRKYFDRPVSLSLAPFNFSLSLSLCRRLFLAFSGSRSICVCSLIYQINMYRTRVHQPNTNLTHCLFLTLSLSVHQFDTRRIKKYVCVRERERDRRVTHVK